MILTFVRKLPKDYKTAFSINYECYFSYFFFSDDNNNKNIFSIASVLYMHKSNDIIFMQVILSRIYTSKMNKIIFEKTEVKNIFLHARFSLYIELYK